ncbi:MAG: sulfatase, partial [Chloroflexaceae bacterium]
VLDAAGLASAEERSLSLAATGDPDGGVVLVEALPPLNVIDLVRRHHPDLLRRHGYDQPCQALISGDEKLIRFGERHRALYNHRHDLEEHTDLYAMLPERADMLEETLEAFVQRRQQPVLAPERSPADDPLVRKRLRDLGYLE